MNFFSRLIVLRKVEVDSGILLFSKDTKITLGKGAKIIVRNGIFRVGYQTNPQSPYSHYQGTSIHLSDNATLEVCGDVSIAPGTSIIVNSGGHMTFKGSNVIAHNNLFYCDRQIEIGFNTCTSWNCQFMDSDGHLFYSNKRGGQVISPIYKPLIIGDNVGFQMNVMVPRGVAIGSNSLISCGVVVRENVEAESLVYTDQQINKVKKGMGTTYGRELE